jgi:hypothetical protein
MPVLLSVQMMSGAQRAHERVRDALHYAERQRDVPAAELPWRVCRWFRKDGTPTRGHGAVILTAARPREVLLTTVPAGPDAGRGAALLAAARQALDADCLDAKRPLLVLCDWLEEHGLPQHALLREFCGAKQKWLPACVAGREWAKPDREAQRAGGPCPRAPE